MFNPIRNEYFGGFFINHLERTIPDFNFNIEVPKIEVLLADLITVSPKPTVFVFQNKLAESMVKTEWKHLFIQDHDHLKYILENNGIALIPAGLLTKDIMDIPGLYLITMNGVWPYVDMPQDISEDLNRMGSEHHVTVIEEGQKGIIVPPDIAGELWDVDMLSMVFDGYQETNFDPSDKMACARLIGQTVRYLKPRDVRMVTANFKEVRAGFQITFIC